MLEFGGRGGGMPEENAIKQRQIIGYLEHDGVLDFLSK